MTKIIFLDRDGVLNENREDYVKSWSEVKILPGVKDALEILKHNGFIIVIITNQSCIGRGIISEDTLSDIHKKLNEALGGYIDDFFYCPHTPEANCGCRKPKIQLLVDAAKKYNVELKDKWFIGDNSSDILVGKNAGMKTILVKTGLGAKILENLKLKPDHVSDDLTAAVNWLIENEYSD